MTSFSVPSVAGSIAEPGAFAPVVEDLGRGADVESLFLRLAQLPHCLFLDSALRNRGLGRYSFVTADPFEFSRFSVEEGDALVWLAGTMRRFPAARAPGLPPFQGGAAGLLGYDLGRQLERVPAPRFDEFQTPALAIGLYDVVVAVDHLEDRAWIISQGFPELEHSRRRRRAEERLAAFRRQLETPAAATTATPATLAAATGDRSAAVLTPDDLAPQYIVDGPKGLTSSFSRSQYLDAAARAIDYIHAGDIFQVNLAQRLLFPAEDNAVDLYRRLRRRNPATFAGYFDTGPFQILSASPERFLQARRGQVEARPIKGTRRRSRQPEADLFGGSELLASEKDRAENVMIVDLLRNDLSRVCRADSVRVTDLCRLENYQFVQHLVSVVRGELRDELTPADLLRAAFPGGSITGAPKVRAMEIIAELEPTARGPYCGSLGYLGFDGAMDFNILIRTITAGKGWLQAPVGGGIVAQSSPEAEYEETWDKAEGLLRAMQQ